MQLGTVQELDLTSGDTPSARVLFESAKDAEKAVKRLHEHIIKGWPQTKSLDFSLGTAMQARRSVSNV